MCAGVNKLIFCGVILRLELGIVEVKIIFNEAYGDIDVLKVLFIRYSLNLYGSIMDNICILFGLEYIILKNSKFSLLFLHIRSTFGENYKEIFRFSKILRRLQTGDQ